MKRILVTGALGQIGSELTLRLRERFGSKNVIASDVRPVASTLLADSGPYVAVDVNDADALNDVIGRHQIDTIYHMAAILSAKGEREPMLCWNVNMNGTLNILEAGRRHELERIMVPSSIAAFGPETPQEGTPQETIMLPKTMYGITKVSGELLGQYYIDRHGLDIRGVRYPGIISSETLPGGGTTDYAVEVFYKAVLGQSYTFFVREDTTLPMMYMPDAIKALIDLADAGKDTLRHATGYNLAAMSFSAGELAAAIAQQVDGFEYDFAPDYRQEIADAWPHSIDDSCARAEWGWKPDFDLDRMVNDMLERLRARRAEGKL